MDNKPNWRQLLTNIQEARLELNEALDNFKNDENKKRARGWLYKTFGLIFTMSHEAAEDYLRKKRGVVFFNQAVEEKIKVCVEHQILEDGEQWQNARENRNNTTHYYEEHSSDEIADFISKEFREMLDALIDKLESLLEEEEGEV